MRVVEDWAADCASIASVRIQSWDLSHHEKPSVHKTAMKCEIPYQGKTLQHFATYFLKLNNITSHTFTLWISTSADGGSKLPSKPIA